MCDIQAWWNTNFVYASTALGFVFLYLNTFMNSLCKLILENQEVTFQVFYHIFHRVRGKCQKLVKPGPMTVWQKTNSLSECNILKHTITFCPFPHLMLSIELNLLGIGEDSEAACQSYWREQLKRMRLLDMQYTSISIHESVFCWMM